MLPRMLRAKEAMYSGEDGEDIPCNMGDGDPGALAPEMFRMRLARPVRFEVILRALRCVCYRQNAKCKVVDIRVASLNEPTRAIVLVTMMKSKIRFKFKAVVLVEGDFASFSSL